MRKEIEVAPTPGFRAYVAERDLYGKVAEGAANEFGSDSRAYKTFMKGVDPENGKGSQLFFNVQAELYLPKSQGVVNLRDAEKINDRDSSFFEGFYTDTTDVVLRTSSTNYEPINKILEALVSKVPSGMSFTSEHPLLISGLELKEDLNSANPYGLVLVPGKNTEFRMDERFAHSNGGKKIPFGNSKKTIWTRGDGLSRVYLVENGDVGSDDGDLSDSDGYGRVVVFDAEGVANKNGEFDKSREKYHSDLRKLQDRINAELRQ